MVTLFAGLFFALLVCSVGMLPVQFIRLSLGVLLGQAAVFSPDPGSENKMAVIIAPFTQSETLTFADLTLASSHGLTSIVVAPAPTIGVDPSTDQQLMILAPNAAGPGFVWTSSGSFPPNITVYGFALIDHDVAILYATEKLTNPIVVTAAGQIVEFAPSQLTFVQQPLS
jgi:hypothetical protein